MTQWTHFNINLSIEVLYLLELPIYHFVVDRSVKYIYRLLPVIDGETMAEVVANTGVSKDAGYLYYLGKDGNVWRTKMARGGKKTGGGPEMVATAGVTRADGFLYYIDKGGNVARSPMARGRR